MVRQRLPLLGAVLAIVLMWWPWPAWPWLAMALRIEAWGIVIARAALTLLVVLLVGAAVDSSRRRWWLWSAGVVGGLIGLMGIVLLVWLIPLGLYLYAEPKDRAGAEASTRTGMIAGLAGVAALVGLTFTARTYHLTQQGQLTDRYTKAITQLGDDNPDVRLGGIYALERLAMDSKRDHPAIVRALSAFVRVHSDSVYRLRSHRAWLGLKQLKQRECEQRLAHEHVGEYPFPVDVQEAINVLGRLPMRPGDQRADLKGANLGGANLTGAYWTDNTTWPPGFLDTIKTASQENGGGDGVFRVRDGYEVPHSPATG